jgi:tetratricopeptide (TPR) repeat protein
MSKKSKRVKIPARQLLHSQLFEQQILHAQDQMLQGDFAAAIKTCEPLLSQLPGRSPIRVQVLATIGLANGMLQRYDKSYECFTEALTIDPTNPDLWYNHGLASRYTTRVGQSVRDFERAIELLGDERSDRARQFAEELEISHNEVQDTIESIQEQGIEITLDQLIEHQECFRHGLNLAKQDKWEESEQVFRQLIEMGGGYVPQVWGNLGTILTMQHKYDEAEAALKRALEIDPEYTLARNNLKKLPYLQRTKGPLSMEIHGPSTENRKQTLTFYKPNDDGSAPIPHTTIEKTGNIVKGTRTQVGKQSPCYSFFLNSHRHERFTTCPRCRIKTRPRKFSLVIHIAPVYLRLLDKICRYCHQCDLLIVHQDQLEEQLTKHFTMVDPEMIGRDYMVIGTMKQSDRPKIQDDHATQEMIEYLHDFKEIITFERV